MLRSISSIILGACLLWLSGCGDGASKQEPTIKAAGKAHYENGMPVTRLALVFQRIGEGNCSARGRLDDQGNFTLTTFTENDGVPAGKYKVYFTIAPPEPMSTSGAPAPGLTAPPKPPEIVAPERLVHADYLTPERTPLTVDINEATAGNPIQLPVKPAAQ